MRTKHRKQREEAEINITPMLDIVYIMLIFFIVTTSFVRETAIYLTSSVNKPMQLIDKKEIISLEIDAAGGVSVNGRKVDIRAVRAHIQTSLAADPGAHVVVFAPREADAGILVRAVDQARLAGAQQVSLATQAR